MKVAAVLIPIALLLLPSIVTAAIAGWYGIKGKENRLSRPLTNSARKKFLFATYIYISVIFPASASWAVYVFLNNIWFSVIAFFICALPLVIIIPMQRHISSTIPKPPPGGWPDDKARLDAFDKWRADREERQYKKVSSLKWWIVGFLVFTVLLLIILVILATTLD